MRIDPEVAQLGQAGLYFIIQHPCQFLRARPAQCLFTTQKHLTNALSEMDLDHHHPGNDSGDDDGGAAEADHAGG